MVNVDVYNVLLVV